MMSWQTIHVSRVILKQMELTTIQKWFNDLTPSSLENK